MDVRPVRYVPLLLAAEMSGVSSRTLRRWVVSGRVGAKKGTRGYLVLPEEVRRVAAIAGRLSDADRMSDTSPDNAQRTVSDERPIMFAEMSADTMHALPQSSFSDSASTQLQVIIEASIAVYETRWATRFEEMARENGRLTERAANERARAEQLLIEANSARNERDEMMVELAMLKSSIENRAVVPENDMRASKNASEDPESVQSKRKSLTDGSAPYAGAQTARKTILARLRELLLGERRET